MYETQKILFQKKVEREKRRRVANSWPIFSMIKRKDSQIPCLYKSLILLLFVTHQDPLASYDVNNHDEDPMPRYDLIDSNRHGTRCAGEVAAEGNNSICAVGVAFDAGIGGTVVVVLNYSDLSILSSSLLLYNPF